MSALKLRWRSLTSLSRSSSDSFLTLTSSDSAHRWSSSPKSAELGLHLGLEPRDVAPARLLVDPGDDRRGEVQDLLELLGSHVEQVADAARDALEEPDVADRRGEVDVAHPLTSDLGPRDLDAAALADDALVADALVLAAVALPVLGGTEDALAEESVLLGLQRPVVDGLRLGYLAARPGPDLLGRGESDADGVEVVDVDHSVSSS